MMALLEREPLLRDLARMLGEARRGHGGVALVVGEAGIGKTSVVDAFSRSVSPGVRLLWGTCDPLVPPRPFTPMIDIADQVGGELRRALTAGDRDGVHAAMLTLLRRRDAPPAIVVLDDLHWADAATLELFQAVARRIDRLPVLLIGTYRDDEVGPEHPLRLALGYVPATSVVEIRVPHLTVAAVEQLGPGRQDAQALHTATAGNPFFLTQVIAAGGVGLPTSVRDAVLGRVARLPAAARRVLDAAAVLGSGSHVPDVLAVARAPRAALDECVDRGLAELTGDAVAFRHELARQAVLDALGTDKRTALHAAALRVLRAGGDADVARLARHAIESGDSLAVLDLASAAGRSAASLGAHREAAVFFQAAIDHADTMAPHDLAELLEANAEASSLSGDAPAALRAQERALALWRTLDDRRAEGVCLTTLSLRLWFAGEPQLAMRAAHDGLEILELAAPGSPELARALAAVAQRQLVSGVDDDDAVLATRAAELAEALSDERTVVHARTTLAVGRIFRGDERGWEMLEAAVALGRAIGARPETARAIINQVEAARDFRRFELADRYVREATTYLDEHEVGLYHHLLRCRIASIELEVGRWDDAMAIARDLLRLGRIATPIRMRALTIVGLVTARRGAGSPWDALDEALAMPGDEPQDRAAVFAARAEAAWLADDLARARDESTRGLAAMSHELSPWWWSELAFWGVVAGAVDPLPHPDEGPYRLHATRRWRDAADAWRQIGAPYFEAMALAECDDVIDLRAALDLSNALGADVLGRRVTAALRRRGAAHIARGPRASTRGNPHQLTSRQVEVLGLLATGMSNPDIAARLVLSPKTVDHHVSAILGKLSVAHRAEAASVARSLGLVPGDQIGEVGGPR